MGIPTRKSEARRSGKRLLIQPKNWATSVDVAHLVVSRVDGAWRVTEKTERPRSGGWSRRESRGIGRDGRDSPRDRRLRHHANREHDRALDGGFGESKDTPLIDFMLETERKAAGSDLASTAAFSTEAAMGPGPITIAQVAQLYPYDNTLRAVRITGKQLRDYLEFSSRYYKTIASPTSPLETEPGIPGYNFDIVSGVDYAIESPDQLGCASRNSNTRALRCATPTRSQWRSTITGRPAAVDTPC